MPDKASVLDITLYDVLQDTIKQTIVAEQKLNIFVLLCLNH